MWERNYYHVMEEKSMLCFVQNGTELFTNSEN